MLKTSEWHAEQSAQAFDRAEQALEPLTGLYSPSAAREARIAQDARAAALYAKATYHAIMLRDGVGGFDGSA